LAKIADGDNGCRESGDRNNACDKKRAIPPEKKGGATHYEKRWREPKHAAPRTKEDADKTRELESRDARRRKIGW
jgi:hypothetical protein